MREIKFRVYSKHHKKIIFPEELQFRNEFKEWHEIHRIDGYGMSQYDYLNDELMQFTGLKDKNDKDIYEGDIVSSFFKGEFQYTAIVRQDICNPCFVLEAVNYKYKNHVEYDFIQCDLRTNEVVGNIHENPELL